MDTTLSTSITPKLHVTKPLSPIHHHLLRPTTVPNHPTTVLTTTTTSLLKPLSQKDNFTPLQPRYPPKPSSLKPTSVHRRSASGYAAALLDVSQSNGVVLKVARDVKRLLKLLRNAQVKEFMDDETVEENRKIEVVKELVMRGKFDGSLVRLVKLVVDKGKRVDLVKEALEEFESVFYQLVPTRA